MKDLKYDGVGFNAEWVASFKTEKQFLAAPELKHLFPDRDPEARTAVFQQVYALCQPQAKPSALTSTEPKGVE